MKKPKELTVSKLKDDLKPIFSKYIRLRDSDNHTGWGHCCTCGVPVQWKYADAGHFQPCQHEPTRFDERNVNLQCKKCNNKNWNQGEQYKHGKYIDKKYGKGTADELEKLARGNKQWKPYELEEMIEKYKKLVKELE